MAGLASHCDDEVPARGRFRVDHEVFDDLGTHVTGCLEPECVDRGRQVEIVIDGFRDVHHAYPAGGVLFDLHCRVRRVVAADRDQGDTSSFFNVPRTVSR